MRKTAGIEKEEYRIKGKKKKGKELTVWLRRRGEKRFRKDMVKVERGRRGERESERENERGENVKNRGGE